MKKGLLPNVLQIQTITKLTDLKPGTVVITMEMHVVGGDKKREKDWINCTEFDHEKGKAKPWPYIKQLGMGQQCVAKVLNVGPVLRRRRPRRRD